MVSAVLNEVANELLCDVSSVRSEKVFSIVGTRISLCCCSGLGESVGSEFVLSNLFLGGQSSLQVDKHDSSKVGFAQDS